MKTSTIPPLEVTQLRKSFGDRQVLSHCSFRVESGQIFTLLGPNGAGKTVTFQLITGLMSPTAGSVGLHGQDPKIPASREQLGFCPQDMDLPENLTPRETIRLISQHYDRRANLEELLTQFEIHDFADQLNAQLSGGQKRRIGLAMAFCGNPSLVILDEPTNALDFETRRRFWNWIRQYAESGGAVLLTTHYLEEAEELATHLAILEKGKILVQGPMSEVRKSHQLGARKIRFRSQTFDHPDLNIERQGAYAVLFSDDPEVTLRKLLDAQFSLTDLEVTPAKLEDLLEHHLRQAR